MTCVQDKVKRKKENADFQGRDVFLRLPQYKLPMLIFFHLALCCIKLSYILIFYEYEKKERKQWEEKMKNKNKIKKKKWKKIIERL